MNNLGKIFIAAAMITSFGDMSAGLDDWVDWGGGGFFMPTYHQQQMRDFANATNNPHRYGPIDITPSRYGVGNVSPDQLALKDRKVVEDKINHWNSDDFINDGCSSEIRDVYNYCQNYASNRRIIAKAVLFNIASNKCIRAACHAANEMQDLQLWKILLTKVNPNDVPQSIDWMPFYELPILKAKSVEMAKFLVEKGASMQVRGSDGETVLHEACSHEYPLALLEYYIEHAKVDVNSRAKQHYTPLHKWVLNSYYGCLEKALPDMQKKLAVLIAAGARLDLKDAQERTPLDILIKKRDDKYSSKDDIAACDTLIAQYREAMAKSDVNHNNQ